MSDRAPWAELLGDWDPMPMLAGWLAARGYRATALVEQWDAAKEAENPAILDLWAGLLAQMRHDVAMAATRAFGGRNIYPDKLDDLILPMLRALAAEEARRGHKPDGGAVGPGGQHDHGRGDAGMVRGGVGDDRAGRGQAPATFGAIVPADTGEDDDLRF